MKKLITLVLLSTTTLAYSACTINLDVKKQGAKTAYVNGVSVSSKIRTALATQCTMKYKVLSKSEVKAMNLKNAKARYDKLLNDSKS